MKTSSKRLLAGLAVVAGALVLALPVVRAADESAPPSPEARREKMEKGGDRLADALGLSDDQRAKFKVINEQERAELKTLRGDTTLSDEDRRAKAGEVRQKFKDQRDALLTPEQKAKADKMHARMEKRRDKDGDQPAAK